MTATVTPLRAPKAPQSSPARNVPQACPPHQTPTHGRNGPWRGRCDTHTALSLSHLAAGIAIVTSARPWEARAMAVGIDLGFVTLELAPDCRHHGQAQGDAAELHSSSDLRNACRFRSHECLCIRLACPRALADCSRCPYGRGHPRAYLRAHPHWRRALSGREQIVMTRTQQLQLIYRHTHRDFKAHGAILVLRAGGTTLVPLSGLTNREIEERLPYAMRQEAKRPRALRGTDLNEELPS